MKANIITFHCVPNYGAMLQSYAMQKLFESFFDKVELLDYRPFYLTKPYKYFRTDTLLGRVSSLLNLPTNIIKYWRFNHFLNHEIRLTAKTYYRYDDIQIDADCLILGSDQIWNLSILGTIDKTYYGILPFYKGKRIAYAASIGSEVVSEDEKVIYKELVDNMDAISVRENQAKSILLSSNINKSIDIVLDPTLMIDSSVWRLLEHPIHLPERYIALYSLCSYESTYEYAKNLSKQRGLPIVEILGRDIDFRNQKKYVQLATCGPKEFLYVLDHAEYVVTDSFHGTAFSIIFRKKFMVDPHKKRGGRMRELLAKLDLSERLISADRVIDTESVVFMEKHETLLRRYQEESRDFITNAMTCLN